MQLGSAMRAANSQSPYQGRPLLLDEWIELADVRTGDFERPRLAKAGDSSRELVTAELREWSSGHSIADRFVGVADERRNRGWTRAEPGCPEACLRRSKSRLVRRVAMT